MNYQRVTVDQIEVGDRVARARTHEFVVVDAITEGPVARTLLRATTPDPRARRHHGRAGFQVVARPRRTAAWWRETDGATDANVPVATPGSTAAGHTTNQEVTTMSKNTATTRKSATTTRSGKAVTAKGNTGRKPKRSRAKASTAGATKPKATAPKAKGSSNGSTTPDVKVTLKQVAEYAKGQASTDQDAPAKGHVFVQNGRVYLRLEGLAKSLGIESPGKLRGAIVDGLGFKRSPFSYTGSDGKQTSASYFSREVDGMGLSKVANREARKQNGGKGGSPQKRGGKQS